MATCLCLLVTPQSGTKTSQNPAIKENHGKCSCATGDALKELVPDNSRQVLAKAWPVSDFVSPPFSRWPGTNFAVVTVEFVLQGRADGESD